MPAKGVFLSRKLEMAATPKDAGADQAQYCVKSGAAAPLCGREIGSEGR